MGKNDIEDEELPNEDMPENEGEQPAPQSDEANGEVIHDVATVDDLYRTGFLIMPLM